MIIDIIDATEAADRHEIMAIKKGGSNPIVMYGMCGAVEDVVYKIKNRAGQHHVITLLRFHGHGAPGMMNIAAGKDNSFVHHSGISNSNFQATKGTLSELKPFFSQHKARVELHGCNVAKGSKGELLIKNLAKVWGVPVSAGVKTQYGGVGNQFKFEGLVQTADPKGNLTCGNGALLGCFIYNNF